MPRRSPLLTLLVLALPGAAACWAWLGRLEPARDRLHELDGDLAAARAIAAGGATLRAERAALADGQAVFSRRLPTADEVRLDEFRRTVTAYAAEAGVLVTGLVPEPAPEGTGELPLEEFAFTIESRGGYAALTRFVRLVEHHRRLVRVERLLLEPGPALTPAAGGPQVMPLRMTLKLVTYAFR